MLLFLSKFQEVPIFVYARLYRLFSSNCALQNKNCSELRLRQYCQKDDSDKPDVVSELMKKGKPICRKNL